MLNILLFSLLCALSTIFHNKLYIHNKTLTVITVVGVGMVLLSKVIPEEYWQTIHLSILIVTVWGLIIYSFFLKKDSNQCRRRREDEQH